MTANGDSLVENRFLFQGRDYLKDGAIYDYRNRFYHPVLGRFLQPDPIGFQGDAANIYRFCGNNAVNRIDPLGLEVFDNLPEAIRFARAQVIEHAFNNPQKTPWIPEMHNR